MVYRWPDWALASLRNIEPYEVMQALTAPRRLPIPAGDRVGIRVLTVWARTANGRPLVVAVREVEPWSWLIIGARDMYLAERAEFGRWEERMRDG